MLAHVSLSLLPTSSLLLSKDGNGVKVSDETRLVTNLSLTPFRDDIFSYLGDLSLRSENEQ